MKNAYLAVDVQGSLLPQDVLSRIAAADRELPGMRPEDYHLAEAERLGDAASRRWDYLLGAYRAFLEKLAKLPAGDTGTSLTRDRWLLVLLNELGFGRVPFNRGGLQAGEKEFPISHLWHSVPMHLLGWNTELDKNVPGVIRRAPQSMLQEFLNLSDDHLWGVLSNGRRLRILRDSTALVGSAYVEFDLEAIFDGELYSEFVLLYTLLHASRFELIAGDESVPTCADCWLEKWRAFAAETGLRARDQLRDGVKEALEALGTGFLIANPKLREQLSSARLSREEFHHELLRLAYQLIFIFVAEDRGALLDPDAAQEAMDRYATFFSSRRLRRLAIRRSGDRHSDLWKTIAKVIAALGDDNGLPALALPGLGGLFFRTASDARVLTGEPRPDQLLWCDLPNEALLTAVRKMCTVRAKDGRPRDVDYQHLGAEELGSVYESLLQFVPYAESNGMGPKFELREKVSGNDRKTTGSYYTPSSLIESLLDTALNPVIDEHAKSGVADDLLKITVCDPACGSGHFLVAAARRIAKRYAAMATGEDEPVPKAVRKAMRKVVAACIYGVDINPLAAELAKVSLWIESLEPGKPLAFLDAHIKVGNALLGATPRLIAAGIPDGAFKPIEGDDKSVAGELKKRNAREIQRASRESSGTRRGGQEALFDEAELPGYEKLAQTARALATMPVSSVADVREQERRFRKLENSEALIQARRVADAWCAAFVWRKHTEAPEVITTATIRSLESGASLAPERAEELRRLIGRYRFFHWHLEFPEVFRVGGSGADVSTNTGWEGGFTCVLGNPPWERIAFDDDEYFASRAPWVLEATTTAERKRNISKAILGDSLLHKDYTTTRRERAEVSQLISESSLYPLTAAGRLATQGPFSELTLRLVSEQARIGLIVPTSVLTAIPMKEFWGWLRKKRRIKGILDIENSEGIFPAVHRSTKFTLLTMTGGSITSDQENLRVGVYIRTKEELVNPDRVYEFPLTDLEELNPITKQLPICKSRHDVELLLQMSRKARPHLSVKPWVGFTSEGFSHHYEEDFSTDNIALFEGKMMHQFDSAFASYADATKESRQKGKPAEVPIANKAYLAQPRFYAPRIIVDEFLSRKGEMNDWILVVRDYVRATDAHTAIATVVPRTAPIQPLNGFSVEDRPMLQAWALAAINSFAYDYMAKLKTPGQHFNVTIMSQTPIPEIRNFLMEDFSPHVAELTYTNKHMKPWASALGYDGMHFIWDEERRALIRAELDAAFFHLYGVARDDVDYIMETFPIVKRKDEAKFGEYRTKLLILEVYEAMQDAIDGGKPYRTPLIPPPGHGPRHPAR
ncbi:Eco57I restriction-modification methylase domain-containing protein [Microtetraspora malaysiensis]|uniref:Eco57I restriction-modification methylase domain-containing protein n=1 Tax=Microtetraspora malaysiensis TaxID=161358 RepID=UPI00082B1551|nr:DNA methyltransferase [Microtetraspora malaysiensis]